ncbi:MAG: Na/Pi symporter [Candidatus Eisenbacteria bacterium]|nr:Na/Pi symporter [Candidatus Eisenbacteria bacterium]
MKSGNPSSIVPAVGVTRGTVPPENARAGADLPFRFSTLFDILFFLVFLYLFLFSIDLLSASFKLAGKGFAEQLIRMASNPVAGLLMGIVATSVVQSSSSTTSITVGLVAAGALDLRLAVPIVMGANIGTTVTNTIVSLGHAGRLREFEKAFAASTVHDFFNILAVLVLFPLEMAFHPIERAAVVLERYFEGVGGLQLMSPLKQVIGPAVHGATHLLPHTIPLAVVALVVLFLSLSRMVKIMRRTIVDRAEKFFNRVLFRNDLSGFLVGWILTAVVQSSSVTTSLVVPLVGTGVLSIREIFTYTLGANLGTTITALLASFATGNPLAVTVAITHMVFNLMGIAVFYPARALPIALALRLGRIAARSRGNLVLVFVVYILLHIIPLGYLFLR